MKRVLNIDPTPEELAALEAADATGQPKEELSESNEGVMTVRRASEVEKAEEEARQRGA